MITQNELNAVEFSATNKDFYQIWNEILETAKSLSERWDPTSTNETDPGIVLLKVLTAIADKLNYNIDKNTLEAFMPSATQEESMRKLCEMMGYNIKYYQSATVDVTFQYHGETDITSTTKIFIPKYSNVKDADETINYVTLKSAQFGAGSLAQVIPCIEGSLEVCENDDDNVISIMQLDDNNRYYLPESQIAENGIFITNYYDGVEVDELWTKVDNLNTQQLGQKVFKFGYDSLEARPYVQFPEDISAIIEDGLVIKYIRTNGVNGNISAKTIAKLEKPVGIDWKVGESEVTVEDFTVFNASSTQNGSNIESINSAYNNYKKVIGTFDTLVTVRDYMNKIYMLTENDTNQTPLVSNVIVSDIRDDINRAYTVCGFNEFGVSYTDISRGDTSGDDRIDNFDLVIYPFKVYNNLNTKSDYDGSFTYTAANKNKIADALKNYKTISHDFKYPTSSEIVCIKNYLRLNAKITTTQKVNSVEEKMILAAVQTAIYNRFNMRQLDFGEEIPFDSILECIEEADHRIKNVSLDEPEIITKICTADGQEYDIGLTTADVQEDPTRTNEKSTADQLYNELAVKNVLAGKIPLFDYNESFSPEYNEKRFDALVPQSDKPDPESVQTYYPEIISDVSGQRRLTRIATEFKLDIDELESGPYTLQENEVIQFRMPNLRTSMTYPAFVNYYADIKSRTGGEKGAWATFTSLRDFLLRNKLVGNVVSEKDGNTDMWDSLITKNSLATAVTTLPNPTNAKLNLENLISHYGAVFSRTGDSPNFTYTRITTQESLNNVTEVYYLAFNQASFAKWFLLIKGLTYGANSQKYSGIYRALSVDMTRVVAECVDVSRRKYMICTQFSDTASYLDSYYIQEMHSADATTETEGALDYLANGLGRAATYNGIAKDEEYQLTGEDRIYINYTQSKKDDAGNDVDNIINIVLKAPTIIKPNFMLVNSEHALVPTSSWPKKTGFGPNWTIDGTNTTETKNDLPGMLSLGSSEQIEVRNFVEVRFNPGDTMFVYFEKNTEYADANGVINLFEEPADSSGIKKYTLKENEYFYYTDINKSDIAYYGAGTEITAKNIDFTKKVGDVASDKDTIATNGLAASIPWKAYRISNEQFVQLREYQYMNLVEGCSLVDVETNSGSALTLGNNFTPINGATYIIDDVQSSLPAISLGSNITWEVRSRLEFNVGPNISQKLSSHDIVTLYSTPWKPGSGTPVESKWIELTAGIKDGEEVPMYIRTNYVIQESTDSKDTHTYTYDDTFDSSSKVETNDFILKTAQSVEVFSDGLLGTTTHNFGSNLTKISFDTLDENQKAVDLGIAVNDNEFALVMMHYNPNGYEGSAVTAAPYIKLKETGTIEIYNISDGNKDDDTINWWKDRFIGDKYYLREGINIVKVSTSNILEVYCGSNKSSVLIFSDYDVVKGINPWLDYRASGDKLDAANEAIKALDVDNEFYYNCLLDNSSTIDINTDLNITDTNAEMLSSPKMWYDYNNVNNKFVISEIDSTWLKSGITISRSSKR